MFLFHLIFWFLGLFNQTGSRLRNTENGGWFTNVTYYDDKNRALQVKSLNHLGGVNQIDYQYNFIGEILKERIIYRRTGAADVTALTEYERDNAGRVLQTWYSINGKKRNLAGYEYDELGRLKRRNWPQPRPAPLPEIAHRPITITPKT